MLPRASSSIRGFPCSSGPLHISFVLLPGEPSFTCGFPCSGEPLHINFVLLPSAPSLMCGFPCSGEPLHMLHTASIPHALLPAVAVHAQVLCGGYAWLGSCCFHASACRSYQVTRREDDCSPSAMDARRSGCAPCNHRGGYYRELACNLQCACQVEKCPQRCRSRRCYGVFDQGGCCFCRARPWARRDDALR